jgi:hypothetical protein
MLEGAGSNNNASTSCANGFVDFAIASRERHTIGKFGTIVN